MTLIEEIIPELLVRHNCVIVPGFGGFVAKTHSSTIDFDKGVMYPPYKSVLFNRQLRTDDGLLAHAIAKRTSVAYDSALESITDSVKAWNHTMSEGRRVEIERLGIFYKDEDGQIQFQQDRHFNLLLAAYGLKSLRFESQSVEVKELIAEQKSDNTDEIHEVLKREAGAEQHEKKTARLVDIRPEKKAQKTAERKRKPVARYAAAAVLLPIAFYSIWLPVQTDVLESGVLSLNDFNPFYKKEKGSYQATKIEESKLPNPDKTNLEEELNSLPEELEVYSYRFTPDKFVQVDLKDNQTDSNSNPDITPDETNQFNPSGLNYIVGCFANKSNADNLVKTLKEGGLPAYIVDEHNGLHRVSAGSALSEQVLNDIAQQSNSLGFKGWILK